MLKMAIEWDKRTIIVCAVVGSLGVLSAILGFSAEGTKLTPYTILVYGDACIYPANPALGLGISAVIFLLAAQVIFAVVGGCCGCSKSRSIPSETKRIIGLVCAVFSRISAVIAWALLIQGAAWNANVVRRTAPGCYYLKDGVFAGAGVLSLAATALGITSYTLLLIRQPAHATMAPSAEAHQDTQNKPGEQSPSAEVPILPQPSRPRHPTKSQVVPPTQSHPHPQPQPQGYRHAPQDQQAPPADQDNGSHAPNLQFPQGQPAGAAPPAVACAPPGSGEPAMGQQQVQLPQYVPNGRPQYPLPATAPPPANTPPPLRTTVRDELARATIRLVGQGLQHVLFSNNDNNVPTTTAVETDPTAGDDVGATSDYGNTVV